MIYYEDSKPYDARNIVLMAVKTCSEALFARCCRYGKSPCFLGFDSLKVFSVDAVVLVFTFVNVEKFLKCAF